MDLGDRCDFDRSDAFSYGAWLKPAGKPAGAALARMDAGQSYRGYDLLLSDNVEVHLVHQWPENAIKINSKKNLAADRWQHVLVTYDGSSKAAGIKVYIDGEPCETDIEQDGLSDSIRTTVPLYLGRRHDESSYRGEIDDVRFYDRVLSPDEVKILAARTELQEMLAKDADARSDLEANRLRAEFLIATDVAYADQDKRGEVSRQRRSGPPNR